MKDGTNKREYGNRVVISVSLPKELAAALEYVCEHYDLNKSAFVSRAVSAYIKDIGLKVGEE